MNNILPLIIYCIIKFLSFLFMFNKIKHYSILLSVLNNFNGVFSEDEIQTLRRKYQRKILIFSALVIILFLAVLILDLHLSLLGFKI